MRLSLPALGLAAATSLITACASTPMMAPMPFSQAALPAAVQVPSGHKVALETVARGEITYECREKANMAGQHEWVFVGPMAPMTDRAGQPLGRYFGPPATWVHPDGSAVTGAQLAVAPNGTGNIPLQLVKANPAIGMGVMQGVTHIQRVATQGGVAPARSCDGMAKGQREIVRYQADYIFWKAA